MFLFFFEISSVRNYEWHSTSSRSPPRSLKPSSRGIKGLIRHTSPSRLESRNLDSGSAQFQQNPAACLLLLLLLLPKTQARQRRRAPAAPEAATFEAAQHVERNLSLDTCVSFLSVVDLGNCRGFLLTWVRAHCCLEVHHSQGETTVSAAFTLWLRLSSGLSAGPSAFCN